MFLDLIKQYPYYFALFVGFIGFVIYFFTSPSSQDDDEEYEKPKPKEISRKIVAKHNSINDLWVVIDNQVYDLTKFAPLHPGGDQIANNAGGDASAGFYGIQHPERVFHEIQDHCIGWVPKEEQMKVNRFECKCSDDVFVAFRSR